MTKFYVEYFSDIGGGTANGNLSDWLNEHRPKKWQVTERSGGFWLIAEVDGK